jgi:hypothetical protein
MENENLIVAMLTSQDKKLDRLDVRVDKLQHDVTTLKYKKGTICAIWAMVIGFAVKVGAMFVR